MYIIYQLRKKTIIFFNILFIISISSNIFHYRTNNPVYFFLSKKEGQNLIFKGIYKTSVYIYIYSLIPEKIIKIIKGLNFLTG